MITTVENIYRNYLHNGRLHILGIHHPGIGRSNTDNRLPGTSRHTDHSHHLGTSQNIHHIGLLGNDQCSDIWRKSRFVRRGRHSNRILVPQYICCNLQMSCYQLVWENQMKTSQNENKKNPLKYFTQHQQLWIKSIFHFILVAKACCQFTCDVFVTKDVHC